MPTDPSRDGKPSLAYPNLTELTEEPAPARVARMQESLGLPAGAAPATLAKELAERCQSCRSRVRCTRWLLFGGYPDEYREFCPNASRNEELLRAAAPVASRMPAGRDASSGMARTVRGVVVGIGLSLTVWSLLIWVLG